MEEEKEGLTFGEIMSVIFSKKWLALIVALAIFVLGTVVLYFGYSKGTRVYTTTFSIEFPGSKAASPTFPDNKPFNYRDLVSRESLLEVKASDEKFSAINVDKMYSEGAITVTRNVGTTEAPTDMVTYTFEVKSSYFANDEIANSFLTALANRPVEYVKGLAVEQNVYLKNYEAATYYTDKVEVLKSQESYIRSGLSSLAASTDGSKLALDAITLSNEIGNKIDQKLSLVDSKLLTTFYVDDVEEAQTYIENRLKIMQQDIDTKKSALRKSYGDLGDGSDKISDNIQPTDEMVALAKEIAALERDKGIYEGYINEAQIVKATDEFKDELNSIKAQLDGYTSQYEGFLSNYYTEYSQVQYDKVLKVESSLSLVLCAVISLVVGVLVAAIVAYAVGRSALKKQEAQAALSPAPAKENRSEKAPAVAEAAADDDLKE